MAQTLEVKLRKDDGTEYIKKVHVIRTFGNASGQAVYLHADGSYGYKDGSPLRSKTELDIITNLAHRKAAQAWWEAVGKVKSEAHYAALAKREAELAGDQQFIDGPNSELDTVLYQRRAAGSKKKWEDPFPWGALFPQRPEWWGQAASIAFKDWEYRLFETEEEAADEPVDAQDAELDEAESGDSSGEDF
ncbi:hypothetical protein [Desulfatibacillum aliphaticivorans]|uniref:hypothetical protein n=1 Tax=Desulfatibacillum aliphaticivorans TaxID=218208 RepID=UPI00041D3947|nr:hypothetical protein [Desulfatibacillum aliphaticivorans]